MSLKFSNYFLLNFKKSDIDNINIVVINPIPIVNVTLKLLLTHPEIGEYIIPPTDPEVIIKVMRLGLMFFLPSVPKAMIDGYRLEKPNPKSPTKI